MFHGQRLEAISEAPGGRWHHVKDRFRSMFQPEKLKYVEEWYNQVATRKYREAFRTVVKDIHATESKQITDSIRAHKASNFVRLYGAPILTENANIQLATWFDSAPEEAVEKCRDVFTALQCILQPVSTMKRTFVGRDLPDKLPTEYNRKRIDWNSTKTGDEIRSKANNPMGGEKMIVDLPKRKERITKPKRQLDSDSVMKSMGIQSPEQLEALQRKHEAGTAAGMYDLDPKTGCSLYKTKQLHRNMIGNTRARVVPSFAAEDTSLWISTSKDLLRNYGVRIPERVVADMHPAIARVTASLGFCVPESKVTQKALTPQPLMISHSK